MNKLKQIFAGYSEELMNKVQWPTSDELQSGTVTVLIASVLLAAAIVLADFVFKNVLSVLYSII